MQNTSKKVLSFDKFFDMDSSIITSITCDIKSAIHGEWEKSESSKLLVKNPTTV